MNIDEQNKLIKKIIFVERCIILLKILCLATIVCFTILQAVGVIDWLWYVLLIPFWVYLGVCFFEHILLNNIACKFIIIKSLENDETGENNNEH